ncbi:MAG: ABC transporter substrate-binding protein, partial [Candidatus Thorarchaeota archaeon]
MDWRIFRAVAILLLVGVFVSSNGQLAEAVIDVPDDLKIGPYVNRLVYTAIEDKDQTIMAIQDGGMEMQTGFMNPEHVPTFELPGIAIFSPLRNGYGHITINCEKYPLNISAFRRAFAYAFDKTRVTEEIMDGSSLEHDSLVPKVSGWCIEDDFDTHYYTNQADIGNQILDAANFTIDPDTGYRLAPDGSPFDVVIEYGSSSSEPPGRIAQIGVDALRALDVNAEAKAATFNEYITRCGSSGIYTSRCGGGVQSYDMVFYADDFVSTDVQWLAYEYWSISADDPYDNRANFRNATFDSWRDQLLYSTAYEDVYE